jgi:hypothetical protein
VSTPAGSPGPEDVAEALRSGVPPSTLLEPADHDPDAGTSSGDEGPGDAPGPDPSSPLPDPGPTTGTA